MSSILLAIAALFPTLGNPPAPPPPAAARPAKTAEDVSAREEALRALEREFQDAQRAYQAEVRKATTDEERKLAHAKRPDSRAFARRFLAFADQHPKTDSAARALAWILRNDQSEEVRVALERLIDEHIASAELAGVIGSLVYASGEHVDAGLERIVASAPEPRTRGMALHALAQRKMNEAEMLLSASKGSDTADAPRARELERKAVELFEQVVERYGDVDLGKGRTLGDSARAALFEIRELAIGKLAPDIEGEDIGGAPFRLSDYRGKVVVLDFWGNW